MADVFISFARADTERVRPVADRLASLGYSIFWDKSAGGLERELDAARAVIVAWSGEARHSTQICAEAACAFDVGKLLQIRLDGATPPPPFDVLPVSDMSSERGEWGPLEATLASLVRAEAQTRFKAPVAGPLATANAAGAPKLITIALATSLIAYAGALTEARNGVMSPDQLQLALTGVIGVAAASAALCMHRLATIARASG